MPSDLGVGDSETATLLVEPADTDTVAALTVYPPPAGGEAYSVAASGGDLEPIPDSPDTLQRWTSDEPVVYTVPGRWVLHWDVTGTGEGAEDVEVWVVASPVAGGPTWAPGRSRVANYVPHRTLSRSTSSTIESQDQYAFTFDGTTIPNGLSVSRLIADGVAWVQSRVYPINARSEDAAAVCVALFAASMIERSWPDDEQALQRANDLDRRLDIMLADLIKANEASNSGLDSGIPVLPVWSFPPADSRWDASLYF